MLRGPDIRRSFREWIDRQSVLGASAVWVSHFHARFEVGGMAAYITFLPYRLTREVVELRIQRSPLAKPLFLTHFVLKDEWHARALFREMSQTLATEATRGTRTVVVCCAGEASFDQRELAFLERMATNARELSIPFAFEPVSLPEVLATAQHCAAIMLMPTVASAAADVYAAHRDNATFALPQKVFDAGDARMAMRLVLEVAGEVDVLAPAHVRRTTRPGAERGSVLALNVVYCDRCARLGWRVYRNLERIAMGKVTKAHLRFDDIADLMETLFLYGVDVRSLDAIEVLTPGVVNYCSTNMPSLGDRDFNIAEKMEKHFGIPTFMDNSTNAAAMGSFVLQDSYKSVAVYRHQMGHLNGGLGIVVNGNMISGRYGLAGEPKFFQRRFRYDYHYSELVWSDAGLTDICLNVALSTFGTVEPDVMYFAVNALTDLDALQAELEKRLPRYCPLDLVLIDDYRDRMYLGGAVLALQRLRGKVE